MPEPSNVATLAGSFSGCIYARTQQHSNIWNAFRNGTLKACDEASVEKKPKGTMMIHGGGMNTE